MFKTRLKQRSVLATSIAGGTQMVLANLELVTPAIFLMQSQCSPQKLSHQVESNSHL